MFCTECRRECRTQVVDFGIGAYDYGGAPRYDSQIEEVSDCCEAEVVDDIAKLED